MLALLLAGNAFAPAARALAPTALRAASSVMEAKAELEALAKELNPAIGFCTPHQHRRSTLWGAPTRVASLAQGTRSASPTRSSGTSRTRRRSASSVTLSSSTAASQWLASLVYMSNLHASARRADRAHFRVYSFILRILRAHGSHLSDPNSSAAWESTDWAMR